MFVYTGLINGANILLSLAVQNFVANHPSTIIYVTADHFCNNSDFGANFVG